MITIQDDPLSWLGDQTNDLLGSTMRRSNRHVPGQFRGRTAGHQGIENWINGFGANLNGNRTDPGRGYGEFHHDRLRDGQAHAFDVERRLQPFARIDSDPRGHWAGGVVPKAHRNSHGIAGCGSSGKCGGELQGGCHADDVFGGAVSIVVDDHRHDSHGTIEFRHLEIKVKSAVGWKWHGRSPDHLNIGNSHGNRFSVCRRRITSDSIHRLGSIMLRQNITPRIEGAYYSGSVGEKMSDQVRRVVIGDQKRAFLDRPEVNHRSARHGFRGGNAQGEMDQLAGAGRI